jgi:alpha-1,3-glucosyltransferase
METVAIVASLALKMAVGRWGYSGRGDLPMLGDFEAQRHWMEVTLNLPIGDWYRNTADNNLQYWGLDYPPLTAYVSWAFGFLAQTFYPNLVLLHKSKGYELPGGKFFMRSTVIIADIIVLNLAILCSLQNIAQFHLKSTQKSPQMTAIADRLFDKFSSTLLLLLCLIGPSNILIDHGHFQYNGVCIGLALLGSTSILEDRDVIGSIFFCLALNFKQMALYYAPVFFFALLRKCLDKATWQQSVCHLSKIGSTVILSFAALWWPFCVYSADSETCTSSLLLVLSRQFPFSRGIFEDKVANLWYSASVAVDFRKYFSIAQMAQMSLILTLVLISPIAFDLMRRKINPKRMVLALVNCSMAFFLASFQVRRDMQCRGRQDVHKAGSAL